MNLRDRELKEKKIIVYGAGKIGSKVVEKLLCDNLKERIIAIAVTEERNNPNTFFGFPVVDICKLKENNVDSVVIIAVGKQLQGQVRENLLLHGFCHIYAAEELEVADRIVFLRYFQPYRTMLWSLCEEGVISKEEYQHKIMKVINSLKNSDELYVARLVTVLGTKCSLRCKECNNLMPYFSRPEDLDKNVILYSLKTIINLSDSICKCELIGGEPFVSNNLEDVLSFLVEQEKILQIEITTNGTILPKEKILPLLRNNKVIVRISDYGELVDKSRIVTYLEKQKINYIVLPIEKWISPGTVHKRGRSRVELEKLYARCEPGYYCKTLFEDKIFDCARAASLYELGYMKEEEYLPVNEDLSKKLFKKFILKEASMACDYCDVRCDDRRIVKPAEQLC